jgi:enoyl-CoA hydratase
MPGLLDDELQFVRVVRDEAVAIVWLARPPVNAVHVPMYREITRVFESVGDLAPPVGCVVLAADGKHFCAGNDLDEFETMTPENGRDRMREVRSAFFAIQDCQLPVIAAVQGAALGTGLAIAASADLIVAAEDARFGLPEISIGVMGGARHLMRIAPQPFARQMFFTGQPVSAGELYRVGGLNAVTTRDRLLEDAKALARVIARHSPVAIRTAKETLNRIEEMDLRTGYPFEQEHTVRLSGHRDAKEALSAFRAKRPPVWSEA